MPSKQAYGVGAVVLVLIALVVLLGITSALYVKVDNREDRPSPPEDPTQPPVPSSTVPPTGGTHETESPEHSSTPEPSAGTTNPSAEPTSGPTSGPTEQPETTASPPQTTTAGPVTNYTVAKGQFVDRNTVWTAALDDPESDDYKILLTKYENQLKDSLENVRRQKRDEVALNVEVNSLGPVWAGLEDKSVIADYLVSGEDSSLKERVKKAVKDSGWRNYVAPEPEPEKVDHSAGWEVAGKMLKESMDLSADPCDDFFQYTCGHYNLTHPLGDQTVVSTFDDLQTEVFQNLTAALDKIVDKPETARSLVLLKEIYQRCQEDTGVDYSNNILLFTDEYGGWPLFKKDWDGHHVDIFHILGDSYSKHGVASLLTPMVSVDWKYPTENNILYIDQASLLVAAPYFQAPELIDEYRKRLYNQIRTDILDISHNTETPVDMDSLDDEIYRMVEIEVKLANISVKGVDQRNMTKLYNRFKVGDPNISPPGEHFDWTTYLSSMSRLSGVTLLSKPFVLNTLDYFKPMDEWLGEVLADEAAVRDLVNYLMYRVANSYQGFIQGSTQALRRRRPRPLPDIVDMKQVDLSEYCASILSGYMSYAVGRVYIDSLPDAEEVRVSMTVMINNVLSAFHGSLSGLVWMDDNSTLHASDKVNGLVQNVAFPPFEGDNTKLDDYYKWLLSQVYLTNPQEFFEYNKLLTRFMNWNTLSNLDKTGDRFDFLMSPATVNAWYQPERNSITFPAGILAPPFFRYDFPRAVNYGGIGVVAGHELSHGFDDQGVQFDPAGKLSGWMSPASQKGFNEIAQCVIDEYHNFCYEGLGCINGVTTQGENIGDNGGIKAAYRAYQLYIDSNGPENRLPGLEFLTMDQVFFLSFGHVWCGEYSREALRKQLLTNVHSPGRDRVIGTLRNFPKFGEAFKCARGEDNMYPAKPCNVW